ncbi:MAG: hypothetical protein K6L76_08465 [Agarilytica sp.]
MSIFSWFAIRAALLCMVLVGIGACGGSSGATLFDEDPTADPTPSPSVEVTPTVTPSPSPTVEVTPTATPTATPTPTPIGTFTQVQAIFTANCTFSSCHDAVDPQRGLNLTEGAAYDAIVNVFSTRQPSFRLVQPSSPSTSYLLFKVEGAAGISGQRMPLDPATFEPDPLSSADISLIRTWINAGAAQNSAPAQVLSNKVEAGPAELRFTLQLSAELDAASLSEGAVQLYFVVDGSEYLAEASDTEVGVVGMQLQIAYSGQPPAVYDSIVLSVNDPTLASLMDMQGRLFDGDGDGLQGGMYRYVLD